MLGEEEVEFGYFPEHFHQEAKVQTATLAMWQNDGVKTKASTGWRIPPRPFMDQAAGLVETDIDKYNNIIQTGLALGGKNQIDLSLRIVGQDSADSIRESIDLQNFKPLAPSTVKQKGGSDIQLIESNEMYDQANYKIVKRSDET